MVAMTPCLFLGVNYIYYCFQSLISYNLSVVCHMCKQLFYVVRIGEMSAQTWFIISCRSVACTISPTEDLTLHI